MQHISYGTPAPAGKVNEAITSWISRQHFGWKPTLSLLFSRLDPIIKISFFFYTERPKPILPLTRNKELTCDIVDNSVDHSSPFSQTKTMLRILDSTKMVPLGHRLMVRKTVPLFWRPSLRKKKWSQNGFTLVPFCWGTLLHRWARKGIIFQNSFRRALFWLRLFSQCMLHTKTKLDKFRSEFTFRYHNNKTILSSIVEAI